MKVIIEEITDLKNLYNEIGQLIKQNKFQNALDKLVAQENKTEKYFVLLSQISIKQKNTRKLDKS